MKNLYITSVILFIATMLQAQQFTFDVYFEDGLGNKDTITLGYDATASDTINPQYGEINIVNQAWDSVFEVRLSEYGSFGYGYPPYNPSFQSKKKIMNFIPQPPYVIWSNPIYIAVKNKYRPFHFTWDSTLFQDSVRMSSGFQFYHYVCPGPIWASSIDSLAYEDPFNYCNQCHFEQNGDTIWVISFAFAIFNTIGFESNRSNEHLVKTYPNPAKDIINLEFEDLNYNSYILIYNSIGQLVKKHPVGSKEQVIQLNISDLKSGIYYFRLLNSTDEHLYSGKFIKQ